MLDAEALLEALNSTPVRDGQVEDGWRDDDVLDRWALDHGGQGGVQERRWLRLTRDALQEVASGRDAQEPILKVLNGVRRVPELTSSGLEWHLEAPAGRGLAVELVLAWADVQESLPARLRPCANPECSLFLIDRSRANAARWCSMKTCGNRLKARRHQARAREKP